MSSLRDHRGLTVAATLLAVANIGMMLAQILLYRRSLLLTAILAVTLPAHGICNIARRKQTEETHLCILDLKPQLPQKPPPIE